MTTWRLTYDSYVPERERLREALCTLGNGYFATRGAAPEARADDHHYPGTYVAGVFNRLTSDVEGHELTNEDIVNQPNWLPIDVRVDGGEWFSPDRHRLLDYHQELDLRRGVLTRRLRFDDGTGRITDLAQRRFVHMADPHVAGLETTVLAENYSGAVQVRSSIDGGVANTGVARYRTLAHHHLHTLDTVAEGDVVMLVCKTAQSHVRTAVAARTRVVDDGPAPAVETERGDDRVGLLLSLDVEEGRQRTVEKIVALYTSRDRAISEPSIEARDRIAAVGSFVELLATHVTEWDHLWKRFDIEVDEQNGRNTQRILRLHLFHLLQTVSENTIDLDVGVPARGLHGEAYRGHIFWDEIFIFPLLNYRLPALTRSLLLYRYRRLDRARWAARALGYEGARFPWQSGSNGQEESQVLHLNPKSGNWIPDNSALQYHINVAVAYNAWQYYQVTGDLEFLRFRGAELIIEVARFFASLASYNRVLNRYELKKVMGPDEFHDGYPDRDGPGLDNNSYLNVMTAWVMRRAIDALDQLPGYHRDELSDWLHLRHEEIDQWEDISRKMRICFHGDRIISQFEGYGDLEEFDWEDYRTRYGDIQRLDRILEAEGDSPNRYKLSKQADVLMIFYLLSPEELQPLFEHLGYDWDDDLIRRNVEYYLKRTSHGSTLSRVVHAWVLARTDRRRSWKLFTEALEADIRDVQGGTTEEGIHLGAMAGTVDLLQRCYGGLEVRGDVLWLDPVLPDELHRLEMEIHYRGHRLPLEITQELIRISSRPSDAPPVRVGIQGQVVELTPGRVSEFKI